MNMWNIYRSRIENSGINMRAETIRRERHWLNSRLRDSLSYHPAIVDGEERDVAIINSDNLNEKLMYSMPGEDIRCGCIVEWMDNHWIVTEKDANNEIYTKVKLLQCNYLLKWIEIDKHNDPHIMEQWCTVEDGTKYMTGEISDRLYIVKDPDTRIAVTIPRTEHTVKFNRQSRFLVSDPESSTHQAFVLTKPLNVGNIYNGNGYLKFVMSEDNTTDYDNFELMIPDYYKYFPDENGYRKTILEEVPKEVKIERGSYI